MPKATQPTVTREVIPRSFADVEFDHVEAGITLIGDGRHGAQIISRPIVTIAVDRTTRTILGIGVAEFPIAAMRNCIDDMIRRDVNADK